MPATTLTPAALDRAAAHMPPAPLQPAEVKAWRGNTDNQHAAPQAAPELDLEARMAAVEAAMTIRLEMAAMAIDVNTAHVATDPIDLADVVRVPVAAPRVPVDLYPTPVAALLQRAHQRLMNDGWRAGAMVDAEGARCLWGAIRIEAGGNRAVEAEGLGVLMDAIRRKFVDADSVPSFNDSCGGPRVPLRLLDQAATLADARGI